METNSRAFRPLTSICLASVLALAGGCMPSAIQGVPVAKALMPDSAFHKADWTPLKQQNYAAADDLFQKAQKRLNRTTPVKLIRLNNIGGPIGDGLGGEPPISWIIPQQIGGRFAEVGLAVTQPSAIAPPPGQSPHRVNGTMPLQLLPNGSVGNPPAIREAGRFYLEGDYAYLRDDLLVSLRLIDGRTNQILATSDYNVDVTADIYALLDAKTSGGGIFGSGWMR